MSKYEIPARPQNAPKRRTARLGDPEAPIGEVGVQMLRTSERSDWRRCPWRWDHVWNKGLRKNSSPTWAWFGTAIHAGLEARYVPGKKRGSLTEMLDAFFASVGDQEGNIYVDVEGDDLEEAEAAVVDAKVLGEAMLRGYVAEYGEDSEWEVIHTEQPFQITVPHPETDAPLVAYAGTWDVLMRNRFTKAFWLWDHKTRKTFPKNWSFYNINDQSGSYIWVAPEVLKFLGVFGPKDRIEGLIFNALKKALPDERPRNSAGEATNKPLKAHFVNAIQEATGETLVGRWTLERLTAEAERLGIRVVGDVSKRQPVPLFHREESTRSDQERVRQAQRVQSEAIMMEKQRTGVLPLWKNPTEDCVYCPMFDLCEMDEQDPESAAQFASTMYTRVDPYRDHREDMVLKGGVTL